MAEVTPNDIKMKRSLMQKEVIKPNNKSIWELIKLLLQYITGRNGTASLEPQEINYTDDCNDLEERDFGQRRDETGVVKTSFLCETNRKPTFDIELTRPQKINTEEDDPEQNEKLLKPPSGLKKIGLCSDFDEFNEEEPMERERSSPTKIVREDEVNKKDLCVPTICEGKDESRRQEKESAKMKHSSRKDPDPRRLVLLFHISRNQNTDAFVLLLCFIPYIIAFFCLTFYSIYYFYS